MYTVKTTNKEYHFPDCKSAEKEFYRRKMMTRYQTTRGM